MKDRVDVTQTKDAKKRQGESRWSRLCRLRVCFWVSTWKIHLLDTIDLDIISRPGETLRVTSWFSLGRPRLNALRCHFVKQKGRLWFYAFRSLVAWGKPWSMIY